MKQLIPAFLITALAGAALAAPPEITNVRAEQRDGTKLVDIWYDAADADGDGMTALDEFVAYTDPTNAASFFAISIETGENEPMRRMRAARRSAPTDANEPSSSSDFAISWPTAKGRVYWLYATDSLSEGWDAEPVAVLDGTGGIVSVPVNQTAPAQFFRVTVDLAEPMGEGASGSR